MAPIQKIFSYLLAQGKLPEGSTLISYSPVSGGDINQAYKLETTSGWYFIKTNTSEKGNQFECEKAGLLALRNSQTLPVSTPIANGRIENTIYLVLEWVGSKKPSADFWTLFGRGLAHLHNWSNDQYGFETSNFIGSLPQQNGWHINWIDFFVLERMEPMVQKAFNLGLLTRKHLSAFDGFYTQAAQVFPSSKPSLLHGDLWSGNFIYSARGAVLIDPAVYFGHSEMELAFTKMFGGFHPQFYESYNDIRPLEKGFIERIPIYNLYPNLIHLILFGASYLPAINGTIEPFRQLLG